MTGKDEPLRLLADGMLGRLARWLRLLGYDTACENDADDLELARARAGALLAQAGANRDGAYQAWRGHPQSRPGPQAGLAGRRGVR